MILKLRHKLTTKTITDVCRLLRLFRVSNTPKSYASVKCLLEQTAPKNTKSNRLHICRGYNTVYKNVCENTQCQPNISQVGDPTFHKFSIKDQIYSILLSEPNLTFHCLSSTSNNSSIADIQNANWYQDVIKKENSSNLITLLLNVDGIAMSNSSDHSLWVFTVSYL